MGAAEPVPNDDSIADGSYVLRIVHPKGMAPEGSELRVSSHAFQEISDKESGKTAVSVFEEARLRELGYVANDLIAGAEGFGVVAVRVGLLRELNLGVTWEPNVQSFGAAHVHINGIGDSRSMRRKLAALCEYRVWPLGDTA